MIAAFKKKILETTWDDLNVWAGTRSVARGKGYVSRVEEIEELPSGELIAHVQGSDRYLTKIGLDGVGEFKGECSCPVGRRCKHTVALILKAAKELREGRPIEKCSDMDSIVDEARDAFDDGAAPIAGSEEDVVTDYVASLKDRECRTLLTELVENLDVVRPYLKHKLVMSRASTAVLVKLAKRAIDTATSGYYDPWDRRGGNDEVPNYENVREFFEKLRSAGDWKSLRDLGFRVLDKGQRQIMCSHDEGEIYGQIADCIEVVQSAISKSPLSAVEKAHWALEFEKRDEFSFSKSALAKFFDEGYLSKDEWSALADELLADCRKMLQDNRIDSYDLGRPIRHAVKALRGAGRDDEVVDLLKEALPRTKGYASFVDLLRDLGRTKEAREWCLKGIADCDNRESGIAADLRGKMRSFAIERGDSEMVAAYDAQSFFSHPSTSAFVQMRETCEKVGKWDEVRQLALQFLENGKRPESKRGWPLPKVDSPVDHGWELNFPEVRLLIELALQEKRLFCKMGHGRRNGKRRSSQLSAA